MRILLLSSAFSGLTQRFYTELNDAGYIVSIELHHGNIPKLLEGVDLFKPDLILCPFLTQKIPADIYEHYKCLIVHPGIEGDRGPSSLDWAIQNNVSEWGVTLLEAQAEMDMGDIWAKKTFPMRNTTKSSLFNREVTQGAIDCLWEVLTYFDAPDFIPTKLDYNNPKVKGQLQPMIKQQDRAIDWQKQTTDTILRHLHAADGSPGVLDEIYGQQVFLYNAHKEDTLTGKAGDIIATANHAICRATVDGAIWIGHLKPKLDSGEKGIKLPASFVLKEALATANNSTSMLAGFFSKAIKNIEVDYTQIGRQLPCQEAWYQLDKRVAYLYFPFHNGGMSTEQCQLLLSIYQHVTTLDVDVIVLMGGEECWSNGIHLNHIEVADDPAEESWLNINAIDDLILQIISTLDKVTISAMAGSAGAGGAILALATDMAFAREGVILNPHYKNMGQLYGSEYWTYLLPKRVGEKIAAELTDTQRLPLSAKKAWHIGLIDKVLDKSHKIFTAQIKHLANTYVANSALLQKTLAQKSATRCTDEAKKPLASYRQFELTQMHANFYGSAAYHQARKNFVYKISSNETPENIALHRQTAGLNKQAASGSMSHFVWQQQYELGDDVIDSQHKDLFNLAQVLIASHTKEELLKNIHLIYQHVKEHFVAEESLMQELNYHGLQEHNKEHNMMLKKLTNMDHKINDDNWNQAEVQDFVDEWGAHIIHSDMSFNDYMKLQNGL
ncbi:MAG: putative two-component system protein, hydrogenase maturation factor HypX/HoxX [Methyloprofundus sp.]|nr:MAG: putative two-component system protein, hydrogenase maturation factor HypX/HoxX [Methyloprofundus sp.]